MVGKLNYLKTDFSDFVVCKQEATQQVEPL